MSVIAVLILFLLVPSGHGGRSKRLTKLSDQIKQTLHSIPEKVSRAGDLFYLATVLVPPTVGESNNSAGRRSGIDTKTETAVSNGSTTERGITSVQDYRNVGQLNAGLPSGQTSVLWTKKELEAFTENELHEMIGSICNPAPILSDYTISDLLIGTGSSGNVFKATNKTKEEVAIKVIRMNDDTVKQEKAMVLVELEVSRTFFHENIVHFINAYSHRDGTELTVYLVMEYMTGGTLGSLLGKDNYADEKLRMTEDEIATVCVQVLGGLKCLHDKGVFHREIKPGNIMLTDEGLVKLCDFWIAANKFGKNNERLGSRCWFAPEVLQCLEYNEKFDIWSLGIVVIEMADGVPPHLQHEAEDLLFKICKLEAPKITLRTASSDLIDFVRQCLNKDPSQRASVDDLLKHPFLGNPKPPRILCRLIREKNIRVVNSPGNSSTKGEYSQK